LAKNYDNAFFSTVIGYTVVSYPEVVHDNNVSNDITITSALRSNVITFGIKFLFS